MSKKLDKKDWLLIELLCDNARLTHQQIARKIQLSKNTVPYRIERLQKLGIIKGFFAIIDQTRLGFQFYELFIKTQGNKEFEKEIQRYIIEHGNVLVANRLAGEWDYTIEFGCQNITDLYAFTYELRKRFSEIIYCFEIHPIQRLYKIEQLPVELIKEKKVLPFEEQKPIEIDNIDLKILYELGQNARKFIHDIASTVGASRETVANRLKELKKERIILRTTAKIDLQKLGYELVIIQMDFAHLSIKDSEQLASFIITHKNVRYAFMSGSRPTVFVYLAIKKSNTIDEFMISTKQIFGIKLISQKDTLVREQYKYDLFPKGFVQTKL